MVDVHQIYLKSKNNTVQVQKKKRLLGILTIFYMEIRNT